MSDRVDVLLRRAGGGVIRVRNRYERDLAAKEVADDTLYAIRNIVQDCQSALDWTANAVKKKYGTGKWSPYFPLVHDPAEFPAALEKQIKGLAKKKPEIAAAFERHQPYHSDKIELGYLHALSRVEKHQDFTPQTRTEQRMRSAQRGPMVVGWNPAIARMGPGAQILGVPVDPRTQLPIPNPHFVVTETVYVDWQFNEPPVSVLPTLERLVKLVRAAVRDVRQETTL
jgi:hypothetical protein